MLGVTDSAASALRSKVSRQEGRPLVRLRRNTPATPDDRAPRFRLEFVNAREPDDKPIASAGGVEIWLAASVGALLDDLILDSEPVSSGWPTLDLHAA
jgi:hypothetical protein